MIKNRRASRVIFVEFLFSNLFTETTLKEMEATLKLEDPDYYLNEPFLKILEDSFNKNNDQIYTLIEIYNNRQDNIDLIIYAILVAATAEMFCNDGKLVISEYLKIGDIFEVNSAFLNGVLDKIYEDICENNLK